MAAEGRQGCVSLRTAFAWPWPAIVDQPPCEPVSSTGFANKGINPVEVRPWKGLRERIRAHAAREQNVSIDLDDRSPRHLNAHGDLLGELHIKAHLYTEVLNPVLNEAWEKGGFKCHLEWELPALFSGSGFVADGVYFRRDALLPDFPGVAPKGCERSYFLPGGAAGTQPDEAGQSAQLLATAAVAAADGSSQAHGRKSQPQPDDAQQPCDPRLLSLAAALEGLADGEEANGRDFLRSERIQQQEMAAHESKNVRVAFMGHNMLEEVLACAIDSSIPELWRKRDQITCSVMRQCFTYMVSFSAQAMFLTCLTYTFALRHSEEEPGIRYVSEAFSGGDTDPSCTWLIDYLMRMPTWEGSYSVHEQQRGSDGFGSDTKKGSGSNGHTDSASPAKRRRLRQRTEDLLEGRSPSEGHELGSGTVSPARRVAAVPNYTLGGRGDSFGRRAGMPPPRELDYETQLSDGFAVGLSHSNSHVFATRCDNGPLV